MKRGEPQLTTLFQSALDRLNDAKNERKGGWAHYRPIYCLWLLVGEIWELSVELYLMWWFGIVRRGAQRKWHKILALEEAGDVMVTFMMMLDVLGVIDEDSSKNKTR